MIKWVKKLFKTQKAEPLVLTKPVKAEAEVKAPATTVKAKKPAAKKTKKVSTEVKHTKASLGKLTKVAIDELAKNELGTDLDRRKTKDQMIKDFLAAQKAKK